MEYARTVMQEAVALWGAEAGGGLLGQAARLVGMQHVHATAAALGTTDYPAFMVAMAAAEGDVAQAVPQPDGSVIVTRTALPLFRGVADDQPAMQAAWNELMAGALAAWDRFARLERIGPLAWRISSD
jgi:hypothetical protein